MATSLVNTPIFNKFINIGAAMMQLIALGGALDPSGEKPGIGGSAYLLKIGKTAVLIDAGAYPKLPNENVEGVHLEYVEVEALALPKLPEITLSRYLLEGDDPFLRLELIKERAIPNYDILKDVDKLCIVATHGHFDHIGSLPLAASLFSNAEILMTKPTFAISSWSWNDSLHRARVTRRISPYQRKDITLLRKNIRFVSPGGRYTFGEFELEFSHAGHILGAISVKVKAENKTVFFSGDITLGSQHTVPGATASLTGLGKIDYLVMESTYPGTRREERVDTEMRLASDVRKCLQNKGNFLLALPAIGRSQEVAAILRDNGIQNIRIDGSATHVTEIYREYGIFAKDIRATFINDETERREILRGESAVVIAPSGMLNGGQAVRYTAAWLNNPANVIAFASYQDPCQPGSKLLNARPGQMVRFGDTTVKVGAAIKNYNLSGHVDGYEIGQICENLDPGTIFLVHGEANGMHDLASWLGDALPAILNTPYDL